MTAVVVTGFNHVNIRTTDIAASARFFVEVLGMEFRQGEPIMGNRPSWLHDEAGRPIIHLRLREADGPGSGALDHVALDCRGKAAILARLDERGIRYAEVSDIFPGVTQVMFQDPHGITLELNFTGE